MFSFLKGFISMVIFTFQADSKLPGAEAVSVWSKTHILKVTKGYEVLANCKELMVSRYAL